MVSVNGGPASITPSTEATQSSDAPKSNSLVMKINAKFSKKNKIQKISKTKIQKNSENFQKKNSKKKSKKFQKQKSKKKIQKK